MNDLMPYGGTFICADCKPVFFQRLREGVAQPASLNYGSVWYRFVAVVIDGIILATIAFAVGVILNAFAIQRASGIAARMVDTNGILNTLIGFCYQVGFLANGGATPGKMTMGLKVVTASGMPISYGRATGRYFANILDAFTLGIGYLMAFFDDQHRALHDRICGTRVITTR